MLDPIVRLILLDPPTTPPTLGPPITNAIAVLLNFPFKENRSTWFQQPEDATETTSHQTSQSNFSSAKRFAQNLFSSKANRQGARSSSGSKSPAVPLLLQRLLDILDRTAARYFKSTDVDDADVTAQAAAEGMNVEDLLQPLLLLLRKIAVEDADAKAHMRTILIPTDM